MLQVPHVLPVASEPVRIVKAVCLRTCLFWSLLQGVVPTAGLFADITIFDPMTIKDRATFDNPHQYPEGIEHVIVNGELVVNEGKLTGARPGRVLKRR